MSTKYDTFFATQVQFATNIPHKLHFYFSTFLLFYFIITSLLSRNLNLTCNILYAQLKRLQPLCGSNCIFIEQVLFASLVKTCGNQLNKYLFVCFKAIFMCDKLIHHTLLMRQRPLSLSTFF